MTGCLFCSIVKGEAPATHVHDDETVVAIEDIRPEAPLHVLVLPVQHLASPREVTEAGLLARMFEVAHRIAAERGVAESGYRLVFNVGADGGQTVSHAHLHLLGGRRMAWPPG